jgi:hypothetical protein
MEKSEKYFFDGQKNPIKNNKFEQKRRFLIFDGFYAKNNKKINKKSNK